jgi:hypothetical protein
MAHWQPVARGLIILALALRSYESIDDPWGTSPCQLVLPCPTTNQADVADLMAAVRGHVE